MKNIKNEKENYTSLVYLFLVWSYDVQFGSNSYSNKLSFGKDVF